MRVREEGKNSYAASERYIKKLSLFLSSFQLKHGCQEKFISCLNGTNRVGGWSAQDSSASVRLERKSAPQNYRVGDDWIRRSGTDPFVSVPEITGNFTFRLTAGSTNTREMMTIREVSKSKFNSPRDLGH